MQIVLNQVTAAKHMIHLVKNLGDKLVDVHSVGQNKVCAENSRNQKETNAGTQRNHPKKYLQQLTTAHWTCSTAAALGVGHEHGNNLYTFFNSSGLFAFVLTCCLTMFMLIFLGLSCFTCMVFFLHLFYFFADRSLAACQPKILSMNL